MRGGRCGDDSCGDAASLIDAAGGDLDATLDLAWGRGVRTGDRREPDGGTGDAGGGAALSSRATDEDDVTTRGMTVRLTRPLCVESWAATTDGPNCANFLAVRGVIIAGGVGGGGGGEARRSESEIPCNTSCGGDCTSCLLREGDDLDNDGDCC